MQVLLKKFINFEQYDRWKKQNSMHTRVFQFKINDSKEDLSLNFSSKTTFNSIYKRNLVKLRENLRDFDILKEPLEKAVNIPPIERFDIRNGSGEKQNYDTPFVDIIQNDKSKIIYITLLPPIFSFKTRFNHKYKLNLQVKRGTKVKDIKQIIFKKFNLGQYDFYLTKNNTKLDDDSSFDEYEQIKGQFFVIIPQNPLYQFKFEKSQPKSFRFDPSTTICAVKSIILPQVSSKRLEISSR